MLQAQLRGKEYWTYPAWGGIVVGRLIGRKGESGDIVPDISRLEEAHMAFGVAKKPTYQLISEK